MLVAKGKQMTDIDSLSGTDFQKSVWRELKKIQRGETISYGELARRIGRPSAVRAVANAVGKNPCAPEIPCHRVIRADGRIGGYSGAGGIAEKLRLLKSETKDRAAGVLLRGF